MFYRIEPKTVNAGCFNVPLTPIFQFLFYMRITEFDIGAEQIIIIAEFIAHYVVPKLAMLVQNFKNGPLVSIVLVYPCKSFPIPDEFRILLFTPGEIIFCGNVFLEW